MELIGEQSLFMNDEGNSDNKEVVIDFFLSWTLRCASIKNKNKYTPRVYEYSRAILSVLLDITIEDLGIVNDVRTWKQSNRIDLWVEVDAEKGSYALLVETKAYSGLHDDQLRRYKEIFDKHYSDKESVQKCYVVVVLKDDIPKVIKEECGKDEYRSFSLETIYNGLYDRVGSKVELTGSDLFDEFWFSTWY